MGQHIPQPQAHIAPEETAHMGSRQAAYPSFHFTFNFADGKGFFNLQ